MTSPIRRFVDWSEPPLPAVARALAEEHSGPDALDLAPLVLVFPGRRPARRMTELLVELAEERGLVLTPPEAVTVGVLPERLYEPVRPLAEGALRRRLWARALRATPTAALEAVLPEPPRPSDLTAWARLAELVEGLHREVGAEGHDFGGVAEACRAGALGFDDSARWEVLARVQERYHDQLDALGRTDRHRARARALAEGSLALRVPGAPGTLGDDEGEPSVHLVGVPEMPGVLKRMLRALAEGGTPVVAWLHAPPGLTGGFDDLGCVVPEAWSDATIPVPDEALAFRDGPAEQASEALRALARFGDNLAPDEVTVGVPDEELVPWLEQRFEAHDVPHRVAAGTPLERTAPYRLLAACADYLDGRRFADLAALLRHPDVEGALGGGAVLETADRYFSEHLPARASGSLPGTSGAARRMRAVVDRVEGEDLLGPLPDGRRPLREWMPEVLGLLERVYGAEPLSRAVPTQRRIVEACEAVRDTAAALHRLPPEADQECGAAAAIRLLLAELRGPDAAIPPEPDRAAVEMLGWLELHLDDAPALVLTGANEPDLPGSVNADLFLPNRLRRELALRDNDRRYARDAYLLSAVLHSRERVRIVCGRRDAEGTPLRPSRLLLTGPEGAVARRLLRFHDDEDGAAPAPAAPLGLKAAAEGGFRVPPEPSIALPATLDSIQVTEFRALLRDPYRWALERHLKLEELDDRARELDPLGFGGLAHEVLELFGHADEIHSADAGAVARRLRALLDRVVGSRFGRSLPSVHVQAEQLRTRLEVFARWHAAWVDRGWRVVATEAQPAGGGVPFDVDGAAVRLKGRIDRIDVHEERGEVAVFDYKTGERAAEPDRAHRSRSGEWRDLQLPLYRHLLPHLIDREGRRVRLGYIRLPREEEKSGHAFLEWEEEELRAADAEARRWIRWLRERDVVEFEADRTRTDRWDPLGALLGRGVLVATDPGEDDEDGEDGP